PNPIANATAANLSVIVSPTPIATPTQTPKEAEKKEATILDKIVDKYEDLKAIVLGCFYWFSESSTAQQIKSISSNGVSRSWKWVLAEEGITAAAAYILRLRNANEKLRSVVAVTMSSIAGITAGYSFGKTAYEEAEKANMTQIQKFTWTVVSAAVSGLVVGIGTYVMFRVIAPTRRHRGLNRRRMGGYQEAIQPKTIPFRKGKALEAEDMYHGRIRDEVIDMDAPMSQAHFDENDDMLRRIREPEWSSRDTFKKNYIKIAMEERQENRERHNIGLPPIHRRTFAYAGTVKGLNIAGK
ncbi:MAG: hypothetical protein LBB06_01310, partial [Endomicrobium sp.]|nr:hypothetical protein [Endomicrobium sp.]